nr:protein TPX2-like isoform X2 [Physcomitrium patens]|eukprot:XP_024400115.1 protein TPX2-like isoform X2 [Physcomitrella patens]
MDRVDQPEVGKFDSFRNIDWTYEFSAPKYYDFTYEETDADALAAEGWFELAIPYENSPHVFKTKSIPELQSTARGRNHCGKLEALQILAHVSPLPNRKNALLGAEELSDNYNEECYLKTLDCAQEAANCADMDADCQEDTDVLCKVPTSNCLQEEPYTPVGRAITGVIENNANRTPPTALAALVISPGSLPAKRLYSDAWKEPPSEQAPRSISKNRLSFSRSGRKKASANKKPIIASFKFYAQPEKKQKLEGERLQKLLYMKDRLPRPKNPPTLTVPREFQLRTDERAHTHPVDSNKASPFVSMAERVRRFHLKTPERFHTHNNNSVNETKVMEHEKGKPKLTVAKSPAFGTSQRIRPPKVKSAAELEEEMLARMPKFKARPVPKKILEAPVLPTFSKSIPHVPEFQEFHLHTMERAQHHASSASSSSIDSVCTSENVSKPKDFSKMRPPQLQTASRVRPSTVKSSKELEEEELANMPKFKARPLNKMIFESKGDLGVHRNQKREVTTPQEFHLKTDERAHSRDPDLLADQVQKLAITKPSKGEKPLRPTIPKPFHLATDDRGLAKGMREIQERIRQQQDESKARIPIANPLPLTTEIPDIPPKPVPKECTKPEPFYLESLLLHEQEQERLAQERIQAEQLNAALREFHAQPNLSKVPAVLPEIPRKALTTIDEFNLLVDQRAVERGEFDKKVVEKQMQYKRYREMYEAAKKAEEERFLKAMRKEMIPTARPMPAFPRPRLPLRSTKEPTKPMSPQFSKKTLQKER